MTSVSSAAAPVALFTLFEQRCHAAFAREQVLHEAALQLKEFLQGTGLRLDFIVQCIDSLPNSTLLRRRRPRNNYGSEILQIHYLLRRTKS